MLQRFVNSFRGSAAQSKKPAIYGRRREEPLLLPVDMVYLNDRVATNPSSEQVTNLSYGNPERSDFDV